jgi:glycosyltransferase involved in cell wall biosynthesis
MEEQTRFIVFTAGYNSEKWVRKNILSVRKQSYENYVHIVVDDATTDRTADIIDKYSHPKMASYRNSKNKKWIYNSITYIPRHIRNDEDVIVIVDMDDWLAQKDVLKKLNKIYTEQKAWLTYGSFVSVGHSKRTSGIHEPLKFSCGIILTENT